MVQSPSDRLTSYWPRSSSPDGRSAEAEIEAESAAGEWSLKLKQCMADYPGLTLATAALAGMAMGWIIKRK